MDVPVLADLERLVYISSVRTVDDRERWQKRVTELGALHMN